MGSRARHSSGRKAASFRARKGKCKTSRRQPNPQPATDPHEILGRLSEALSIIATATSALEAAQDPTLTEDAAEMGDKIACLVRGLAEFRRAYTDMDIALLAVTP